MASKHLLYYIDGYFLTDIEYSLFKWATKKDEGVTPRHLSFYLKPKRKEHTLQYKLDNQGK